MSRRSRAALLLIAGTVAATAIAGAAHLPMLALGVAVAAMFIAATLLSRAGEHADRLAPFVNRAVRVRAWGDELPGNTGPLRVAWIRAFGAGLLIRLQPISGRGMLLKVAQPGGMTLQHNKAEIAGAAYVQWSGARIKRSASNAVAVSIELAADD
jgi:hypothetical protein